MGASNSEKSNLKYFALKAKTSDTDPSPFFGRSEKVDGKWQIVEKFNQFTGKLIDIKHSVYTPEAGGEEKHKMELTIQDPDGTKNIVASNFSHLSYALLNSLASCNPIGEIEMRVYLGKAKANADGTTGRQHPGIEVTNNGQEALWKFQPADLPKAIKGKVGTKVVTDDTPLIEFWLKVLEGIKASLPTAAPVAANAASENNHVLADESKVNDDLPF